MKILYLCQLIPYPPDAGPKVRSYYNLCYLTQKHSVTLVAFSRSDDQPESLATLRESCAAVHTVAIRRSRFHDAISLLVSLLTGRSFVIQRDYLPEMAHTVDTLLESREFDAIHADQLWMAQYALRARGFSKMGAKIHTILDEHNACFQIVQRLAMRENNPIKRWVLEREWKALQRFEARALAQFDRVATVTDEDRATLEGLLLNGGAPASQPLRQKRPFSTIPICVDTDKVNIVNPTENAQDVLHLGTMFWLPNVEGVLWFARQVWPRVIAARAQATFTIAGKNPPAEIQALGRDGAIQVTGYVPDTRPYLERAGVFVVPLFSGSGMRVKIVDAWRWGLPVVSTTIGAEGIRYRDGENILIADEAESFAAAVVRVLEDKSLNQALRKNGRRWVEEHYDWQRIYPLWDQIYQP